MGIFIIFKYIWEDGEIFDEEIKELIEEISPESKKGTETCEWLIY